MTTCPHCGTPVSDEGRFCGSCGKPLPTRTQATAKGPSIIRIGRNPESEFFLEQGVVSWDHAVVTRAEDGQLQVEDLGSTNGTSVNHPGQRIQRPTPIRSGDTLYLGSLPLTVERLLQATRIGAAVEQHPGRITLSGEAMLIGRDPGCDLVLSQPTVSSRHARIFRRDGQLCVEDLGSTNGTFIDGVRIKGPTPFSPEHRLSLGTLELRIDPGGKALQVKDYKGHITLEVRDVSVDVPGKRLIDAVSFTLFPSEMVALMGASGAGKTTLMKVLCGRSSPSQGKVYYNGSDLQGHFESFQTSIGYVPQDDIMHDALTVREVLRYTARLRLPSDTTPDELERRVERVLQDLELGAKGDVRVRTPDGKGISGGQRKRVNIAMELLHDPAILFLDEPTSGLSSEDAFKLVELLRKLADQGKTIIATIHQPGQEVFEKFDTLVFMGKDAPQEGTRAPEEPGQLIYFGPAYPESIQFFTDDSSNPAPHPDDLFKGLKRGGKTTALWKQAFHQSPWSKSYVQDRRGRVIESQGAQDRTREGTPTPRGQWRVLLQRAAALKWRDHFFRYVGLLIAPLAGLALALTYKDAYQQGAALPMKLRGVCFFLSVISLWIGGTNTLFDVVGERAILHRERMANLGLGSYLAAKLILMTGLVLIQATVLTGIVWKGCGLEGGFLPYWGVAAASGLVGGALGLWISAFAASEIAVFPIHSIFMIVMVLFGGNLKTYQEMGKAQQVVADVAIPSRWGFEALLAEESRAGRERFALDTLKVASLSEMVPPAGQETPRTVFVERSSGPLAAPLTWLAVQFAALVLLVRVALALGDPRRSAGGQS